MDMEEILKTTSEVSNLLEAGCPNSLKLLRGRGKETREAREKTMNKKQ